MSEIKIPEGYVVEDTNDDFRKMGLSEKEIEELNSEISRQITELNESVTDTPVTAETQKLLDIIENPNTTWEEKEAARRQLNPEMYDENGNLILDDSGFFDRMEAAMKQAYEEMKARSEAT